MARRSGGAIEPDDLYQCGMLGLVEAALRYEPSGSTGFWSYARHRVIGAMQDELRSVALRRQPESAGGVNAGHGDALDTDALADFSKEPSRLAFEAQQHGVLAEALNALSRQESQVVQLYYRRGLNQREIAESMRLTESRVHQIRSAAIARIAQRIAVRTREVAD